MAGGASDPGVRPFVLTVDLGRRYRLQLLSFGLACCAVEFVAASVGSGVMQPATAPPEAGRDVEVLVVSGTVTDKIAPAVRRLYDAMSEPRAVISFGACANCGGPYWDSYSVTKGVDQLVPVDLYIPGCPPRPEALLDGLRRLAETLDGPAARPASPPVAAPVLPAGPSAAVGPDDLRRPLGGQA